MANKVANVSVRIQPEIKEQAENILAQIGIPISVLIDSLYRQIILTGGIPYSLSIPKIRTLDSMNDDEFNSMMEKGHQESKNNKGLSLDEAFDEINKVI